ncbi:protein FAR1-RELATED SEQUENCE 6-like [Primulina eburnea]|uniref:protein FAR1-RELATED SEQUENCE 6-like n=1 Tax=Primulina eburnea TaxID=1245227 RepID=UPI003C6C9F1E
MRTRLGDSKRWRILEVILEHNHLLGAKDYECSKKMGSELKKNLLSNSDLEVQPDKLYRAVVIDAGGDGTTNFSQTVAKESSYRPNQLNSRKGDSQVLYNHLCRMQLTNSNFFLLMDLNDAGRLRNVIWVDAKSRAARSYIGDVIYFDNTFLSNKYEVPVTAFVGLNHQWCEEVMSP